MTTLSKEDVSRMAKEAFACLFTPLPVSESGLKAFATLARADLVAENERLKSDLSKYQAIRQYKEARKAEVAVLREQLTATRTALAAAESRENDVKKLMAEVEVKYFALLKEQDAEAEQFKAEGDMCGWNFHTGLRSGAVQMHLNMTTLIKAVAQPRDDSALRKMIAGVYEECAKVADLFEQKADALNDSIADDDDANEGRSEYIMGKATASSRIAKAIRALAEKKLASLTS